MAQSMQSWIRHIVLRGFTLFDANLSIRVMIVQNCSLYLHCDSGWCPLGKMIIKLTSDGGFQCRSALKPRSSLNINARSILWDYLSHGRGDVTTQGLWIHQGMTRWRWNDQNAGLDGQSSWEMKLQLRHKSLQANKYQMIGYTSQVCPRSGLQWHIASSPNSPRCGRVRRWFWEACTIYITGRMNFRAGRSRIADLIRFLWKYKDQSIILSKIEISVSGTGEKFYT